MKELEKLLFVDDDKDILTVAKYSLENLKGTTIKFLDSGEEAIKEALNFHPDLIILDVMMPKMDGIATLEALKLIPSLSNIPIVFITAKVQKNELVRYKDLGITDVILKPFNPMTLADSILAIWNKCN